MQSSARPDQKAVPPPPAAPWTKATPALPLGSMTWRWTRTSVYVVQVSCEKPVRSVITTGFCEKSDVTQGQLVWFCVCVFKGEVGQRTGTGNPLPFLCRLPSGV